MVDFDIIIKIKTNFHAVNKKLYRTLNMGRHLTESRKNLNSLAKLRILPNGLFGIRSQGLSNKPSTSLIH